MMCTKSIWIILLSFIFWLFTPAAKSDTITDYYKLLNDPQYQRKEGLMGLLESTSKIRDWSLGAGLGPTDKDSLRLMTVTVLYKNIKDLSDNKSSDQWVNTVVASSKITNSDQAALINLLKSEDAAMRWIGLQICAELNRYEMAPYVSELKNIFEHDKYIVISMASKPQKEKNEPPVYHDTIHVFRAPLREKAASLLLGESSAVDYSLVCQSGIALLLEYAFLNPVRHDDVKLAIEYLDPLTDSIRKIQEKIRLLGNGD